MEELLSLSVVICCGEQKGLLRKVLRASWMSGKQMMGKDGRGLEQRRAMRKAVCRRSEWHLGKREE